MPPAIIFIILDFKDFLFVAKQFLPEEFSKGKFSHGAIFIVGIFMGRKFRGNFSADFFQEEVSLNHSNHSTTVQIFQRSQNTFNVVSTNYST